MMKHLDGENNSIKQWRRNGFRGQLIRCENILKRQDVILDEWEDIQRLEALTKMRALMYSLKSLSIQLKQKQ